MLSYKTPWIVLGFLYGFIMLCGCAGSMLHRRKWQIQATVAIAFCVPLLWLGSIARKSVGRFNADPRNPYVYAHSGADVMRLAKRIKDLAPNAPQGFDSVVKVVTSDCLPMPWYLRNFPNTGFWSNIPEDPDAPFLLTDPTTNEQLQSRLKDEYSSEFFGLRPGKLLILHVRKDIWDKYLLSV